MQPRPNKWANARSNSIRRIPISPMVSILFATFIVRHRQGRLSSLVPPKDQNEGKGVQRGLPQGITIQPPEQTG